MITKAQIIKFNTLLSKFGFDEDDKRNLIYKHSEGRTIRTKELTSTEAKSLLDELGSLDPMNRMRRKIFAISREIGFAYGYSSEDHKMNAAKINLFLVKYGTVKKELNDLDYLDLVKVVTQFEAMKKSHNNNQMNNALKQLTEILKN